MVWWGNVVKFVWILWIFFWDSVRCCLCGSILEKKLRCCCVVGVVIDLVFKIVVLKLGWLVIEVLEIVGDDVCIVEDIGLFDVGDGFYELCVIEVEVCFEIIIVLIIVDVFVNLFNK